MVAVGVVVGVGVGVAVGVGVGAAVVVVVGVAVVSTLTDRLSAAANYGGRRKKGDVPYDVIVARGLLKEAADRIEGQDLEWATWLAILNYGFDLHTDTLPPARVRRALENIYAIRDGETVEDYRSALILECGEEWGSHE